MHDRTSAHVHVNIYGDVLTESMVMFYVVMPM